MLGKRTATVTAGLFLGAAVLAGCSTKYSSDDLKKELTTGSNAMSQEQANCIVDGLNAKGVPLDKYKDPSADDQKKITDVVTDCVLKGSGITMPSSVPAS